MADMRTTEDAAVTEQLRSVITRCATALVAGDFAALRDCYHDHFTLNYAK